MSEEKIFLKNIDFLALNFVIEFLSTSNKFYCEMQSNILDYFKISCRAIQMQSITLCITRFEYTAIKINNKKCEIATDTSVVLLSLYIYICVCILYIMHTIWLNSPLNSPITRYIRGN